MKGIVRAVMVVGLMGLSATVFAETINVGPKEKNKTIQAAITSAKSTDTISVAVGTYAENITISAEKSGIALIGAETARTFLKAANNQSPVISISGATSGRISNFTFIESTTGIQIGSASAVNIAANVFNLGTTGTAVHVSDAADKSTIANNTFYENKSAVDGAAAGTNINNNILASNTTAISNAHTDTHISFNQFFRNGTNGPTGTDVVIDTDVDSDPSFVDPTTKIRDFHSTKAVHAKQRGAYSGSYADLKPFPVQGVTISESTATLPLFSVTVSWAANASYLIDSYNVQFELTGSTESVVNFGPSATPGTSPQSVGNVLSVILSGSALSVADSVAAPVLSSIEPKSQALKLTWSPVANATGYEVHYGVDSIEEKAKIAGNVTSYILTGLQNGVTYLVSVVAIRQPVLHAAVAAQDSTLAKNSNDYSVSGATRALGDSKTSSNSNILTAIPEEVVAYPALPNEGCFIATAAYGSYSAAQVKTLRDFRDNFLLTNTPGRAFVSWYYANSPPAAHYLNQHPALKPVVRGLLLPFVFITSGMNSSTFEVPLITIALTLGLMSFGFYWRRRTLWA